MGYNWKETERIFQQAMAERNNAMPGDVVNCNLANYCIQSWKVKGDSDDGKNTQKVVM